MFNMDQNW